MLNAFFPRDLPGVDVAPGVTVRSRSRPDYDYPDIRAGDVIIRPQVAQSFGYNDNLLGQSHGPGSALMRTESSVQAVTDWSRNALGLFVGTDNYHYFDLPSQNENNWRASLSGSLDIGRDTASFTYRHLSDHQNPSDIDSLNFNVPLAYDINELRAAYRLQFSRFSLTPAIELLTYRFSPGSLLSGLELNEKGRNRNVLQEELTGRYEITPQSIAVAVVRPVQVHYTSNVSGSRQPGSTGVSVLGGFDYQGDGPWRYRALAGVEYRKYARSIKSQTVPIAEGAVSWTPTGLTTVTGELSRSIEDAGDEDGAGYTYLQARLGVDHEYRRNVLLNGYVGVQNADYLQTNRTQTIYQAGVGATWLLNRYMRLAATYEFLDSTTSGALAASITGTAASGSVRNVTSPSYARNLYLLRLEFGRFDPFY